MTDRDPHLDELLSAHLDGETTADDAARIEADPARTERLAELDAARRAVSADPPRVDASTRDATLARVFAQLDRDESRPPRTPITQLSTRRRNPGRFLAAAAAAIIAVALLGGAIGMLANESGGGDDDSASSAGNAEMSTQYDADGAGGSAADNGSDSQRSATGAPASLGTFGDSDELTATVRQQFRALSEDAATTSAEAAEAPAAPSGATTSDRSSCRLPDATSAVFSAVVDGQEVLVAIVPVDRQLAVVLDPTTCTEVLRITQQ